jgi:cytochrome c553
MRLLSVIKVAVWLGVSFMVAPATHAQTTPQRMALCASCHGADGNATLNGMPSLAAQPALFLETQLVLIREGIREIPSMTGMLNGFTDVELTAIAAYYADKPLAAVPKDLDPVLFARGGELAQGMRCGICHLPTYLGRDQIPRLAGQREDYLLHSLLQFRNGEASGRDSNMTAAVYGVSDGDLKAMSYFLSRVPAQ